MKPIQAIVLLLILLLAILSLAFFKIQKQQNIYEKEIKQLNGKVIDLITHEISSDLYSLKTEPIFHNRGVNDSLIQCLEWLREELLDEHTFNLRHFQDYHYYVYNTLLPIGGFINKKGQVDASLIKMTFDTTWTDNKIINQSKKIKNVQEFLRYISRSIWTGRENFPYRFYFLQETENLFYEKDTIEMPFLFFANYHYKIDKYSILPAPNVSHLKDDYKYSFKLVTDEYKEGVLVKAFNFRVRNNFDDTIDTSKIVIPYRLKKRIK